MVYTESLNMHIEHNVVVVNTNKIKLMAGKVPKPCSSPSIKQKGELR